MGTTNPAKLVELLELHDPFGTAKPENFVCPTNRENRVDSIPGKIYPLLRRRIHSCFQTGR